MDTPDSIPENSHVKTWKDGKEVYSGRYAHAYMKSASVFYLATGTNQNIQGKIRCVRDGN